MPVENSSKTIAILVWNMGIGGVQKRCRDIAWYISKYYPQFKIIFFIKRAYDTPLLKQIKSYPRVKIIYFSTSKKFIPWPTFFWLVKNYLKYKPDILLAFLDRLSIQAVILKKLIFWHKVKLILNEGIYTSTYLKIHEPLQFIIKPLIKLFYPKADLIIAPTFAIKDDLSNNFSVPEKKIKVIPHWIINPILKSKTSQLTSDFNNIIYDFIFVGRMEKEKNIWWLIDLAKYFQRMKKGIKICVLGKGTLEKEFLRQILKNKLTNYFNYAGFQADIIPYLKKSKILLLPSQNEGMPNCVLESYSLGIPAIVYNFPGASEIVINNQTGLIIHDKKEFIKQCQNLIDNASLRKQMGFRAYKLSLEKFGEDNLKKFVNNLIFHKL